MTGAFCALFLLGGTWGSGSVLYVAASAAIVAPAKVDPATTAQRRRRRRRRGQQRQHGLLVAEVEPGSFADEIRMLRGDLILEVNRQPVLTLREFRAMQRKLGPGRDVVFWIMRRGRRAWVRLRLGGTLPE